MEQRIQEVYFGLVVVWLFLLGDFQLHTALSNSNNSGWKSLLLLTPSNWFILSNLSQTYPDVFEKDAIDKFIALFILKKTIDI